MIIQRHQKEGNCAWGEKSNIPAIKDGNQHGNLENYLFLLLQNLIHMSGRVPCAPTLDRI